MHNQATQRSRIADDLLRGINEGSLPVGSKLPSERRLAEQYEVSRPVVREALGMLVTLDVLSVQVGRGAFVTSADIPAGGSDEYGLLDFLDVREAIESGALRLAVERAGRSDLAKVRSAMISLEAAVASCTETPEPDLALHRSIVSAARSSLLDRIWSDMTAEIARTIRISPHGRTMDARILSDHRLLVDGILGRDIRTALGASSRLHDDHRRFLRSLLG